MVFSLFIGVFFRYVMYDALTWSDEIGLLSFSWSIFLCSSVLVYEKSHANLTLFLDVLPKRMASKIQTANTILIGLFGLVLLISGWQFISFIAGQVSPTIRYPLWLQVIPIPISGGLIVLHTINQLIQTKE